ncbi:MAG: helix-hairpin-helix domain-containing protein [Clostridia bacterium]|nr:helix-hairpin-helix domain-containing protein [Clostridia bacterium]
MLSSGRDYVLSAEKTTRVIEPVPTAVTARSAPEGTDAPEKLNLNTASYDDLLALPGIGPTYAQAILDYRAAHGPFHFIEEVMDVRGIGPKRFDAIKRLITCGD